MDSVKTFQDYISQGKNPEIIFWVGCAGSFDERAQRVSKAFANILQSANISIFQCGIKNVKL